MPQTDAEYRLLAEHACDGSVSVRQRRGVAGSVRQKNSVGIMRKNLFGSCGRRKHLDAKAGRDQPAQNVQLDSVVDRNNRRRPAHRFITGANVAATQLPVAEVPIVSLSRSYFLYEIA